MKRPAHWSEQAIQAIKPKPEPQKDSWWLRYPTRKGFYAALPAEQERMEGSSKSERVKSGGGVL